MTIDLHPLKIGLSLLFIFFFGSQAFAQPLEVTNGNPFTPENLITNVFLGDGVEVLNVSYQGQDVAVGFFKNGLNSIGIDRGLVMTTGNAATSGLDYGVAQTGSVFASVNNGGNYIDPDLVQIAGSANLVNNAAVYTITFIPIADTLRFNYAFGSEEYPEYTCSQYNDIFGFFIHGPGISGPYENNAANIALIPGTNRPVTINNINSGMVGANGTLANCSGSSGSLDFSAFYNDNNNSGNQPTYDGFTTVLTAEAIVMPCSTYTIKLAICDVSDGAFDSGVFLEAKSFGTGSLDVQTSTVSLDGSVVEGCAEGVLTFSLPSPVEADFPLDYTIIGTAINGVDYITIPENLFIPAGDSSVSVPIVALEDGLDEGIETILIDVQLDPCNRDTFTVLVRDNPLIPKDLGNDTTICLGESVSLDGRLPVPLPPPPTFTYSNDLSITPTNVQVDAPLNVVGVIPPILGPGVIKSVCIDSLSHRWIDDIDVYLFAPNGQFMELTTDNGGNGGNGLGPDFYLGTCFTENASTIISSPGPVAPPTAVPFTGDWLPEGVWSDLYGSPSNGTWRLQLIDDTNGLDGTLHSWTICFNPLYEIRYFWVPSAGLSCDDCPDPIATPDQTTTYVMTAIDSYGCEYVDSITIVVEERLPAPNLSCANVSSNSIDIVWDDVPGATAYEVSVDGSGWQPTTGGMASYNESGLALGQMVTFMVRTIGPCDGDTATITCETLNCFPPSANAFVTDATCFGATDGSIEVMANSNNPPLAYELNGVPMGGTSTFTDLAAGAYNVEVIDDLGCSSLLQIIITEPNEILLDPIVLSTTSCPGTTDGSATVTITGGSAPYSFNWDNGVVDSIATNLGGGIHSLEITDANNCTTTTTLEILEPEPIALATATEQVSCNSAADGTATVTAQGGTEPYSYLWDAGAGNQMTATALGLSGGTFEVTVSDANNCEAIISVDVAENSPVMVQTDGLNVSCAGGTDGSVIAASGGGSGDYTYEWTDVNSGTVVGDQAAIVDLPAGEYGVLVTDSDGCTANGTITIVEPEVITPQIDNLASPDCTGDTNGSASLSASGGEGNYSFNWDNGISASSRTDLAAGTYVVTVLDGNNCETTIEVVIPDVLPLELTISSEAVSCNGGNDGSALVSATGGTGTYTYQWGNGQNTPEATNLSSGTVTVEVTDENGCVEMASIEVTENEAIALTIDGIDPLCANGTDGEASVTATGGTGDYTYAWSSGDNAAMADGLNAGTHEVTVTDGNGCEAIISIELDEPTSLSATSAVGLISCNGEPDGSAVITPDGGTPPYSYSWDDPDGQTTAEATGLLEGTYTVLIIDANGCTIQETVEVLPTPAVELAISTQNVSCNGGADGSIEVIASGGTPPYTYNWDVSGTPAVANPSGLQVGDYVLSVSDANGCMVETVVSLQQPDPIVLSAIPESTTCDDTADGAINLSAFGGVGSLRYRWSNGSANQNIENLIPGVYAVTATDDNGCSEQLSITVTSPSNIEAELTTEEVDCFGASTGSISSEIRGGVPPYSYNWSNGSAAPELTNVSAGSYRLEITDANGCQLTRTVEVVQPAMPINATVSADSVSCFGTEDGMVSIAVTGGTPYYRYSLDGDKFGGTSTFIGLEPGSYNVYVEDSRGCLYLSDVVVVEEPAPMNVQIRGEQTILFGDSLLLEADVNGGRGSMYYEWTPIDTSCIGCDSLLFDILYQTSFKVKVTDEFGCSSEDIFTVNVRKNIEVAVPTGFSPNDDQVNDRLLVHGREGIRVTNFRIFDRWGEMVYEGGNFMVNDTNGGWDGTFRGEPVSAGIYLWQLEVIYLDGAPGKLQGQTTVIR